MPDAAPSIDDLRKRTEQLFGGGGDAGTTAPASGAATGAPSVDDLRARVQQMFPSEEPPPAKGNGAAPDAGTGVAGLRAGAPLLPSWLTGGGAPAAAIAPPAPSPGLPDEMPTTAGNLPSETPGAPSTGPSVVPSLDDVRNWLEQKQATTGSAPGELPIARGGILIPTALGVLDVLQGRYQIGESGNPLTVRPTPETLGLASFAANPLRFGGARPMPPPIPPEANINLLDPALRARIAATPQDQPVPPQPVTTPTPFQPAAPTEPAPVSATGVPPPAGQGAPSPTFLDSAWLKQAGDVGQGYYDMGKGASALTAEAQQALARGDKVQLVTDGGRKTVDITRINPQGMLTDASGQPWGTMSLATDGTGKEGLRITPTAPQPASVGAAASREGTPQSQIDMTTAEMKANRRQAEKAEILAPPELGDTNIYVKGSLPTKAEYAGDPVASQTESILRSRDPQSFEGPQGRLTQNNAARVTAYEDMTPSDTALQSMKIDRDAQWQKDTDAILPTAKPVDLTPVKQAFDDILDNPRNLERDELQRVLGPLRDKLFDADGNLKTDPAAVWGMHDNLQTKLAKAKDSTSEERYVLTELNSVKKATDAAMNVATDNRFQTALDNYANASRDINSGELLRGFRDKLTNQQGTLQANRFHNFIRDLAERRGEPGIDPSMDISDDTMRGLINIDKDLKRSGLIDLGKARGSPTNLYGAIAKNLGIGMAHAAVGGVTGGAGLPNLLLGGAIKKIEESAGGAVLRRRVRQHLAPPPGGYGTNYLDQP